MLHSKHKRRFRHDRAQRLLGTVRQDNETTEIHLSQKVIIERVIERNQIIKEAAIGGIATDPFNPLAET